MYEVNLTQQNLEKIINSLRKSSTKRRNDEHLINYLETIKSKPPTSSSIDLDEIPF
jgi:hypothetical protein